MNKRQNFLHSLQVPLTFSLAATIEQSNTSSNLSTVNVLLRHTHARAGKNSKKENAHPAQREAVQKWATKLKIMAIALMDHRSTFYTQAEGNHSAVSKNIIERLYLIISAVAKNYRCRNRQCYEQM